MAKATGLWIGWPGDLSRPRQPGSRPRSRGCPVDSSPPATTPPTPINRSETNRRTDRGMPIALRDPRELPSRSILDGLHHEYA